MYIECFYISPYCIVLLEGKELEKLALNIDQCP